MDSPFIPNASRAYISLCFFFNFTLLACLQSKRLHSKKLRISAKSSKKTKPSKTQNRRKNIKKKLAKKYKHKNHTIIGNLFSLTLPVQQPLYLKKQKTKPTKTQNRRKKIKRKLSQAKQAQIHTNIANLFSLTLPVHLPLSLSKNSSAELSLSTKSG